MTVTRIRGGSDLRARLSAIPDGAPELVAAWGEDAAKRMRATAPHARRPASREFTTKARGMRAAVYGAFWWIFVDRGAKRHTIFGSGAKNPPETLKFSRGGRTIFAKKVNHPGQRRKSFISRAAQEALAASPLAEVIVKQWNRRKLGKHKAFL